MPLESNVGTDALLVRIKSGLIRSLFADGLLTSLQRDELLRQLRAIERS